MDNRKLLELVAAVTQHEVTAHNVKQLVRDAIELGELGRLRQVLNTVAGQASSDSLVVDARRGLEKYYGTVPVKVESWTPAHARKQGETARENAALAAPNPWVTDQVHQLANELTDNACTLCYGRGTVECPRCVQAQQPKKPLHVNLNTNCRLCGKMTRANVVAGTTTLVCEGCLAAAGVKEPAPKLVTVESGNCVDCGQATVEWNTRPMRCYRCSQAVPVAPSLKVQPCTVCGTQTRAGVICTECDTRDKDGWETLVCGGGCGKQVESYQPVTPYYCGRSCRPRGLLKARVQRLHQRLSVWWRGPYGLPKSVA